jgi:hypothetical protein
MGANYNPLIIMQAVELSTSQLADRLGVTPRMINIYKCNAENFHQCEIGTKRGRTTYFSPEEQELISRARAQQNGHSAQAAGEYHSQRQAQQSQNFQASNSQNEAGILDGMGSIVEAGDRNALALGQHLGQRWSGMVFASAIQTMQQGLTEMSGQFNELQTAMNLSLTAPQLPQLPASQPLQLPEAEDDF